MMRKLYRGFLQTITVGVFAGFLIFGYRETSRQDRALGLDGAALRRRLFKDQQVSFEKASEKPRAGTDTGQRQQPKLLVAGDPKSVVDFMSDTSPLRWDENKEHSKAFDSNTAVPKLVHFTWYSTKRLTFRFHHFISALSAHKHIQPKKIMFWHEKPPIGQWWEETLRRIPNIQMVYRKGPTSVYGNPIRISEHQSDVVRLEAILKYGGIYMDLDVIVLKSFDPLLQFNTTMGYETADGLCNGLIVSKPSAPFLTIWHEKYKLFSDRRWNVHSVKIPAQLAKTYPELIHTEEDTFHKPNWRNTKWLYNDGFLYDWSKNYAVHLWYRFHKKDHNPNDIKTINTTMGELFRFIYYGSPKLIH